MLNLIAILLLPFWCTGWIIGLLGRSMFAGFANGYYIIETKLIQKEIAKMDKELEELKNEV